MLRIETAKERERSKITQDFLTLSSDYIVEIGFVPVPKDVM